MHIRAIKLGVLIWTGCVPFSPAVAADGDGSVMTNNGQTRALSPGETDGKSSVRPAQPKASVDPYSIPVQPISSLTREQATAKSNLQVRVQGVVLDQRVGEYLVIRDDAGSIRAETSQMVSANAQQPVDLWGTPAWDGARLYLSGATFRVVMSNAPPGAAATVTNKPAQLPLLTKAQDIRDLPPERAAWQYPIRLRGVVTIYLPQRWGKFCVQDDTCGIFVRPIRGLNLKPGDLVEIEGVSDPGGFAPIVLPSNVTVVGSAPLPEAAHPTLYQLAAGQYNSQWIEARGVVRSIFYTNKLLQLKLSDSSGGFLVNVPADEAPSDLLDAIVRINGVCGTQFNKKRQITGSSVWAPSLDYVQTEQPGVADPLSLPEQPILGLSQFRPGETVTRRQKVAGVVTVCQPRHWFFVQDAGDAIRVFTLQKDAVKPGDRVEVAGYPAPDDFGIVLRDAVFRVTGHGPVPVPKPLLSEHDLDPDLDDTWVTTDARLLSRGKVGPVEILTLQIPGRVFEAHCLAPAETKAAAPAGSRLHLTGVYRVLADEERLPSSFQLLVPSSGNIQVLEQPSWWTFGHSMMVVGALSFILTATILWVFLLHRQVGKQTRRLRVRLEREAALEQRYHEIFEGANDLIFTHDLEGRLTSLNPAGLRVLGYGAEEVKQLTIYQVFAPECHQDVRHVLNAKVEGGEVVTIEGEFVAKDGQRVLVEASVRLTFKDGQAVGVQGIARDITARKRAEAVLTQTSSLLKTLLENSPDQIYFKDTQSRFVRFSKSTAQKALAHISKRLAPSGQPMAEQFSGPEGLERFVQHLVGKTDFDIFTEEHARAAFEDEQQIIRSAQPVVGKLERETHPDDKATWCLTSKMPWRDKDGNIIGTFGVSKDVTAIKEAEDQLAYERELFRALLDNIPDAIYFKDRESRFVRVSKSKLEKSREVLVSRHRASHPSADPAELPAHLAEKEQFADYLMGKTDFDIFTEERARAAYEDEQEIIRTGQAMVGKPEHFALPDGKVHWVLATKMPWRDKVGNIIGTFGISRDITALKQAEAELEATHQRLLQASRLAGMAEVATDVLHNVGNVLNSVNVSCSLVLDRVKESKLSDLVTVSALLEQNRARLAEFLTSDPQGKGIPDYLAALAEYSSDERATSLQELEQLRKNIDHIKQIVAMQQSYAKVAGLVESVAVSQLVEDALQVNMAALQRHVVQVRREFETIPPILTVKHKVLQTLVNLIRNAKYALDESNQPDRLLTIKVGGDGNGHVKIQVSDNGVGIPKENLTRIFAHGFTTRRNGHGFGLHSSALAVQEIGGSLHAHSDGPNTGARFTLLLPHTPPALPK